MERLEVYAKIIFNVMPIMEILISGYCFYRLIKPFMDRGKRVFLVGITYILIMLALYFMPLNIGWYIMAYGMGAFVAFLVMCRIDRKNYGQKIFLSVTFFALREFAYAMAEILYDRLYHLAENTEYMLTHPNMWFALYVGVCIIFLTLEFGFMIFGIWCISKSYQYKVEKMSQKELFVMIIPSLMGLAGYEIIWYYRRSYMIDNGYPSAAYEFLSLFYYAVAVVTIVVMIVLYQNIKAGQREKLQNELLVVQLENTKKHIEQVEEYYQNIRRIKHDMTNHILTLERLYAGNQAQEAKAYGEELRETLSEATGGINSGNPVTDVILQEARSEAEKRNIRFQTDFYYPTGTNINAFDVSVILNNALQNALENTKNRPTKHLTDPPSENAGKGGMPHISVLSYHRNNAYMIEVSNSFTGNLQWDKESGLPLTSKENVDGDGYGKTHGYGLANIRIVARKYSGDIAIDLKDNEFRLSIMLMME